MSRHHAIHLKAVGQGVSIACEDDTIRRFLTGHFAAMLGNGGPPALRYTVSVRPDGFEVVRRGADNPLRARDLGMLVYLLDSDLIVQLQLRCRDLLFLHAAAVRDGRGAHLLIGRSGAGKSTTCWGLLHRGFGYLSDELAPVVVAEATVRPFPRALSLKSMPPEGFPLPSDTVTTSRGFDVPVSDVTANPAPPSVPLRTLLFVEYAADRAEPAIRPIGRAEAAARLHSNVLNGLAHSDEGLPAVLRVVAAARAFVVDAAALGETCDAISRALED